MKKEVLRWGYFCDLDQAQKAYEMMGVNKTFHDYATEDGWDEDKFYNDFAVWWANLSYEVKVNIYNQLN